MAKKRKHRKRRHPQPPMPRPQPFEEIIEKARRLAEEYKVEEALEVLESIPAHMQRRFEVLLLRGTLLSELGFSLEAMEAFERALRAAPGHPLVLTHLALLYDEAGWTAHSARAARRALEAPEGIPPEVVAELQQIAEEAAAEIREKAAAGPVPFERMEKALHISEQAHRRLALGRFEEAARLYGRAARVVPNWLPPYNNMALSLFLAGQVKRAIQISETILEAHPENVHALANLIRFYLALGEREKAEEYAARLKQVPAESLEQLDKVIEALGFIGDDEALYRIYRRHHHQIDDLDMYSLLTLGSAAANMGHPQIARRLWRKAKEWGYPEVPLLPFYEALSRGAPGPGWLERYPTVSFHQMVPSSRFSELIDLMDAWEEGDLTENRRRKRVRDLLRRTPFLIQALVDMLWGTEDPLSAIRALAFLGTPEAIEELRRFAFSQVGPMRDRLIAVEALAELGVIDREKPVQIWDEKKQRWINASMFAVEVTTEVEPPDYDEAVLELIDAGVKALNKGALEEAREKLEAALELDPHAAIVHHNLAVILQRMGEIDEGVEHLKKALEIHPDYPFARCSLANFYIDEGNLEAAEDLLSPLAERRRFHPAEWAYYHRTIARLRLEQEDYEAAEQHAQIVLEMMPDDEAAQEILDQAEWGRIFSTPRWQEYLRRRREREEKKRRRPTRPDATLAECLERITKESLICTARAMPSPRKYNVRKAILIQDLAEYLPDPEVLQEIVKGLSDEERQALRDVLEAGGTMDWEEFTGRYGDDLDESPFWYFHEPETVMGRLRMLGLLSEGTVDDRLIVLIPYELRELLPPLLEERG
ncbi:MAG TPA: tetratricopeptide repeat protein [Thermoflexia bacterium]|nr:tetratricopeptide repeat protein [Thermoflexia bacterium]